MWSLNFLCDEDSFEILAIVIPSEVFHRNFHLRCMVMRPKNTAKFLGKNLAVSPLRTFVLIVSLPMNFEVFWGQLPHTWPVQRGCCSPGGGKDWEIIGRKRIKVNSINNAKSQILNLGSLVEYTGYDQIRETSWCTNCPKKILYTIFLALIQPTNNHGAPAAKWL